MQDLPGIWRANAVLAGERHPVREFRENKGELCSRGFGNGASVYFGPDSGRLVFNGNGARGCIYLFHADAGKYNGV